MAQKKKPAVSVVMPVYNSERYIGESIDSILNQTYDDFEFIIIDDSSTDSTKNIVEEYMSRDDRIKLINLENKGLVASLNEGVKHAKGEFIARMDSDDISFPNRLERQISYLQNNQDIVALGVWTLVIDEDGRPIQRWKLNKSHNEIVSRLLSGKGGQLIHPSIMLRRKALVKVGGYDERYKVSEDFDLYVRLSEIGILENLPEVLFCWRRHSTSLCSTVSDLWLEQHRKIITEAINRRGPDNYVAALIHNIGNSTDTKLIDVAKSSLKDGYYRTSLYYTWKFFKGGGNQIDGIRIIITMLKMSLRQLIRSIIFWRKSRKVAP